MPTNWRQCAQGRCRVGGPAVDSTAGSLRPQGQASFQRDGLHRKSVPCTTRMEPLDGIPPGGMPPNASISPSLQLHCFHTLCLHQAAQAAATHRAACMHRLQAHAPTSSSAFTPCSMSFAAHIIRGVMPSASAALGSAPLLSRRCSSATLRSRTACTEAGTAGGGVEGGMGWERVSLWMCG